MFSNMVCSNCSVDYSKIVSDVKTIVFDMALISGVTQQYNFDSGKAHLNSNIIFSNFGLTK
jgi:hypothetical protein